MVVLYRTNAQSRPFEEALVKAGLPYRLVGGFKFYERKEIKDLLAYLRLTVNPADTVSQERVLKLGKRRFAAYDEWRKTLPPQAEAATNEVIAEAYKPLPLVQGILKVTNYLELFDKNDPEDFSRLENIQELENVAAQFASTSVFLENVALVQDDYLADVENRANADVITLMSLHSAKGLEYPVVFMVGLEDGLLPHSRSLMDRAQMEEERRLCYVGITRAKEKLYMSYARIRWIFGTPTYGLRSRFLRDIPVELIEERSSSGQFEEGGFGQRHAFNGYQSYQGGKRQPTPDPRTVKSTSGRHLVIDDDMLDGVLTGDIDIKSFLEN
jgi:DNA helicase-2/ATP-dependent DNA helicase PcrA